MMDEIELEERFLILGLNICTFFLFLFLLMLLLLLFGLL